MWHICVSVQKSIDRKNICSINPSFSIHSLDGLYSWIFLKKNLKSLINQLVERDTVIVGLKKNANKPMKQILAPLTRSTVSSIYL